MPLTTTSTMGTGRMLSSSAPFAACSSQIRLSNAARNMISPDEGSHHRSSEVIRGHQRSSVVIRGHLRSTEVIELAHRQKSPPSRHPRAESGNGSDQGRRDSCEPNHFAADGEWHSWRDRAKILGSAPQSPRRRTSHKTRLSSAGGARREREGEKSSEPIRGTQWPSSHQVHSPIPDAFIRSCS